MLNIVFCGSPEFAALSLDYLIEHKCAISAVVTMPDRQQGRGRKLMFNAVKETALRHQLPVLQPEKATDPVFLNDLRSLKPDLILVVAYGKILRPQFLAIPRYGCVNLHASYLPYYRGASPIHQALLNGDTETGITTFLINEGMDSGDMILREKIVIADDETLGTLHDKLADAGAKLLLDTVQAFSNGMPRLYPQDHSKATYTQKILPEMAEIDWAQPAEAIRNRIRAFDPAPGARTSIQIRNQHRILKLFCPKVIQKETTAAPGTIVDVTPHGLIIACGKNCIIVSQVQLEGKKRMPAEEFIRGYPDAAGIRLN
ncbi:MAG: methionyl-tRNA formyltransferase [Candidatus Auribacter fodinae]|jgi:methionyl-tRNA formyltransferase|uniref:Methionyl-tRNA formyltransferase n=1 Tax=Candidatus Auribacter fodinae TaxID=2093366 RepID=A0A3A4R5G2_9BACT|nr:MAG: methionyl-tRNA formyltransferase [Candidatus Auribacter fodinae]